jgi:hypothetical protein
MKANKHSQSIPADKLEQAKVKIGEAAELLKPYLIALTPAEKQEIPKMGPKTLNFVEKSHEYAHENPSLVPNYLEMDEFDIDFADAHGLWTLHNRVQQLQEAISDTQMTAGSEAYQAALVFYNSVKVAASQGIHGAKAVYEELKKRFPGKKRGSGDISEPA